MSECHLCPRQCGARRESADAGSMGLCGAGSHMSVAAHMLHIYEEPCISGPQSRTSPLGDGGESAARGSGAIFFTGCPLGCAYCQNHVISRGYRPGYSVAAQELQSICFELKEKGAYNINLVTPMHFAPQICAALAPIKGELALPVIINTGGYDSPAQIAAIAPVCDVFLPDFKYSNPVLAARYSNAPDYPEVAERALRAMFEAVGPPVLGEEGMIHSGVIVRHLVLPGGRANSLGVIAKLREMFAPGDILLSLMSQFTPQENAVPPLNRRVTAFEYDSVLTSAAEAGFGGYSQDRKSAQSFYIPNFI